MELVIARLTQGKTQWDLRKETGIPQSKISLFENGYLNPSEKEKKAIAEALGMEVEEIRWPEQEVAR
jgi:DNA-binding XRE family transcriptional regulator